MRYLTVLLLLAAGCALPKVQESHIRGSLQPGKTTIGEFVRLARENNYPVVLQFEDSFDGVHTATYALRYSWENATYYTFRNGVFWGWSR